MTTGPGDIDMGYDYRGEIRTARFIGAGFGLVVAVTLLTLHLSWKLNLATLLLAAVLGAYYFRAVSTTIQEHLIDPSDESVNWKLGVQADNCGIPISDFQRLRHVLLTADGPEGVNREDRVRRVTRKHKVFVWGKMVVPLFLAFVFLVLSVALATHGKLVVNTTVHLHHSLTTTNPGKAGKPPAVKPALPISGLGSPTVHLPRSVSISWWLPFLAGFLFGIWAWVIWMRWKYDYRMITDWNAYLITMPPVWLPFWQPNPLRMSYDEMDVVGVQNSFFGNAVGKLLGKGRSWGSVVLDSPSNHDERFNNIAGQPDHREFADDTEKARRSYKLTLAGASR